MNEANEPKPPELSPLLPNQTKIAAPPRPRADHWLKRLLACNPFYLVSVALLLYGFYRISLEPGIFGKKSAHLIFNFSSLQTYELLLVGTAIFLAHRRIWYDSTLLVGLENLLLLVPFILLTQAALLLAGPAEIGGNKLETIPTGLLAVIASFLLFGVGTLAAR